MNMETNENSKISIIVPVYNAEMTIRRCVDSIINQTYNNLEVVLVDDGSFDNSFFICQEYCKRDNRVKVYHQYNMGTMEAIVKGIEESKGAYIGFVDSDDWIEQDMYRSMLAMAENNEADLVQCGIVHDFENGSREYLGIDKNEVFEEDRIIEVLAKSLLNFWETDCIYFPPSRCNKLIKSDLVKQNLKYCDTGLKMGEDLNMVLPILIDCTKVACMNKSYYHYVLNSNSTTQNFIDNLRINNIRLFQAIDSICCLKNVELSKYTRKYYNYMTILAIFNEYKSRENFSTKIFNTVAICKENPGKVYIKESYSTNLYFLKRLTIRLMCLKLYFLIPFVFKFQEVMGKNNRFL